MNLTAPSSIGQNYLISRPFVYNGGFLGQIMSNIYLTYSATNVHINLNSSLSLQAYITAFFFSISTSVPTFNNSSIYYNTTNTSNLATSLFGLVYVISIVTGCLLFSIAWICSQECQYKQWWRKCTRMLHLHNPRSRSDSFRFATNIYLLGKEKKALNYRLILCSVSLLLSLLSIIFFIFSVLSQSDLETQTMNINANNSFLSTWQQSSVHMDTFLNLLTNRSYSIFTQTISNMSTTLNNVLVASLNNLTSDLLQHFGVLDIFTTSNTLITNLTQVLQSMQYIENHTSSTIQQINLLNGTLSAVVPLLGNSMTQVCANLPTSATCLQYLNESSLFRVVIDTSRISDSSSVVMLFVINEFQVNLTSLALQMSTMQTSLNTELSMQSALQIKQLNLAQSVSKMSSVWTYINETVSPWNLSFSSLSSSITTFIQVIGLTVFIITSLLLVAVAVMIIFYMVTIFRFFLLYYFQRQSLIGRIRADDRERDLLQNMNRLIDKIRTRYRFSDITLYSYIVLYSCVMVIIIIISLLLLNFGHLLYNEVCVQIWRPEGLSVNENFLGVLLAKNWKSFLMFFSGRQFPVDLNSPPPKNAFNGLLNNCTGDLGIFPALNMTNFVNISSFLWSAQNLKTLNNGLNITYSTLLNTNVIALIPKNLTSFLTSASTITTYFDQINYQASIDELSKGVLQLPNYTSWINASMNFFATINSANSRATVGYLGILSEQINNIKTLEVAVSDLRTNFQALQDRRNNTQILQYLIGNITKVKTTMVASSATYDAVKLIYGQRMLTMFPINAEASVGALLSYSINHLFPCANLSLALQMVMGNLCTTGSITDKMAASGMNIAITCGFLSVMVHCLLFLWKDEKKGDRNTSKC